jgi:transposase-like protein
MPSPKLEPLALSGDERRDLEGWAQRRKTEQALALRSRIVLACADGSSVSAVAAELGTSRATAGKWRSRFLEGDRADFGIVHLLFKEQVTAHMGTSIKG